MSVSHNTVDHAKEDLLKPFADMRADEFKLIKGLDDDTLRKLYEAAQAMTEMNCWWFSYVAAQAVGKHAAFEIADRHYKRKFSGGTNNDH
jgi:hypothetical protein